MLAAAADATATPAPAPLHRFTNAPLGVPFRTHAADIAGSVLLELFDLASFGDIGFSDSLLETTDRFQSNNRFS